MMQSRDEFLNRVLHDLKAPARHLKLFSEMLRESLTGHDLPDESAEYLEVIERAGAQMTLTLESLGRFLRVPARGETQNVDLAVKLHQRWERLRGAGEFEITGDAAVDTDATLVEILLDEVLSNAIRFASPDRTLCVRCEVSALDGGAIRVTDNGIGIPSEFLAQALDPFQCWPVPGIPKSAGLGLATCRKVLEQLGGSIFVDSDGSTGTTVSLRLST